MKRPTWATIVGVLGIIFGCFGIIGAGQEMLMPNILKMQKEIFAQVEKSAIEEQTRKKNIGLIGDDQRVQNQDPDLSPEVFKSVSKMWEFPDWFGPWSVFAGFARAIVSALYLLASIWLLQKKSISIRWFYWAAGSSIALWIIKGIVAMAALSFLGMAMMVGGAFGALIDIILIIVVATGNKAAFRLDPASSGTT
jgi:hypothetical protein